MKKTILTVLTALFLLVSLTGMGNATTLDYKISMDNKFEIYLSTDATPGAEDMFGSGADWKTLSTGSIALETGTSYFLHVWGINFVPEGNPAGFLGEFTLSGSDHMFANNTTSLLTNTSDWTAGKDGWGGTFAEPTNLGKNGVLPWEDDYTSEISSSATWIWAGKETGIRSNGITDYPADDVTYFSTQITSTSVGSSVPEPATMLLFGLGLLGVAGVSRRKK